MIVRTNYIITRKIEMVVDLNEISGSFDLSQTITKVLNNPPLNLGKHNKEALRRAFLLIEKILSLKFILPVPEHFKDLEGKPKNSYFLLNMMKKNEALLNSLAKDRNRNAIYLKNIQILKHMISRDIKEYVVYHALEEMGREIDNFIGSNSVKLINAINLFLYNVEEVTGTGVPIFRDWENHHL